MTKDTRFLIPENEVTLTDKQAIDLVEAYGITQKEIADRLGIHKATYYYTHKRMKEGGYSARSRGAVERAKLAIAEILKEKGVIIK